MPTRGVVIDAFKNLIRHGRHAEKDQQKPPQNQEPAEKRDARDFRREAEEIVKEEREKRNQMPVYKGLEHLLLIEKMGDGAFSNVYKARDTGTGQMVAVKIVRKFELSASQRANILKEVQIMRGTNHPSIVKLISFSESDEYYFLVLELMQGGELFHQIVKLTYFSEKLSRHVILQVAQGIRYLHEEKGVVHRDIKPENLLFEPIPIIPSKQPSRRQFDEDKVDEGEFTVGVGGGGIGRIKIADFGLSKVVWNEETMTPCGTVGYTAPEIVKDERYSKSVDMWALGCVLYTLLCGFPPFYDESINILTEKVARGHYTFLSPWWDEISASAKDLISHLLCVDPAQRYTIDEFLQHPWCHEDSSPLPTPQAHARPSAVDSPLLHSLRNGREARSPGLATLKEAFDVTYAVHRMEEEGARRRAYNGRGGAGTRGFLQGLNEDDEGSDGDEALVKEVRAKQSAAIPIPVPIRNQPRNAQDRLGAGGNDRLAEGRAGTRDRAAGPRAFELDMNGATLLGRRHKRSPLGQGNDQMHVIPIAAMKIA